MVIWLNKKWKTNADRSQTSRETTDVKTAFSLEIEEPNKGGGRSASGVNDQRLCIDHLWPAFEWTVWSTSQWTDVKWIISVLRLVSQLKHKFTQVATLLKLSLVECFVCLYFQHPSSVFFFIINCIGAAKCCVFTSHECQTSRTFTVIRSFH